MASDVCYLGERHRVQRKMFTPVFSIAHMREMGMCQKKLHYTERHIDAARIFSPHLLRSRS